MKLLYPLAIISLLIMACSKPKPNTDIPDEPPVDHNPIPPATPVSTNVTVYAEMNGLYGDPMSVKINGAVTDYAFSGYSTNTALSVEKYDCNIGLTPDPYLGLLATARNVPLTGSSRNNVDVNNVRGTYLDRVFTTDAGEWALAGDGKLTFGANTFEEPGIVASSPAYAILDPTATAFSITNPSFKADVDGHRWYLWSFGVFLLDIPYKMLGKLTLQYPIAAGLRSTAPDSIAAWLYLNNQWVQQGYAKKTGNFYTKEIHQGGIWSFGELVDGMYKTFKVRTSNGLPVVNAILRVKSGDNEVASARTDAEGNAICFLPAHENLTADILLGWRSLSDGPPPFVLRGPFNSSIDEEIILPASSPYITSVKGTAINCGGGPIQSGTVTAICQPLNSRWYLPVTNGQYGGAYVTGDVRAIFLMNASNDAVPSTDTAALLITNEENIVHLTTCKSATNLFLKYSIDDVEYNITGDAATPGNSFLASYYWNGTTDVSCQDDQMHPTMGLDFSTSGSGTGTFLNLTELRVNNVLYEVDYNRTFKVTFTRYDMMIGGYVEGSLEAYYKDKTNVVHHLVASFRLKQVV